VANRTVSVALVADVGQYQSAMIRAASTTKGVGTAATTAGTQAQRGFATASQGARLLQAALVGGVALGLKSTVDAAADAEQSIGGAQAVFKGYADTVIASSHEADRALGLSANSYRELATIIGSQMKNAGVPLDQLADKTEGIIGIGADLAAQFGGSTQQAVEALSSAFRGELDPIERYGISLTAAAVGAKAVEMGLSESATGLSQNAKAMATLAIITEQSADAQGAFSREADTAAGRAQRAAAQWENLKVAVGDRLLPVWSALVDVLGTEVIPALGNMLVVGGDVIGFLGEHKEIALALAAALAVQLAGGIGAVTAAFNRMILTPAVLGLNAVLGTVLDLPAAFAAVRTAVAGFIASVAPLAAAGAVVYGIIKLVEHVDTLTSAGEGATAEIGRLRDTVKDAGTGAAGIDAMTASVDDLRDSLAQTQALIDAGGGESDWFTNLLGPGTALADRAVRVNDLTESAVRYRAEIELVEQQQARTEGTASALAAQWGISSAQVLELAERYGVDLSKGAWAADTALRQAHAAATAQGDGAVQASLSSELYAAQLENVAAAADEAKKQTDLFKMSLDILTGATVTMAQVEGALYAAIAEADGALEDMNGSVLDGAGNLNMQSEAGRAAADVLFGVRDQGNQLIATMREQGATTEELWAKDAQLRESFIDTAMQMGISREAAEVLTDQILGIPEERRTTIIAQTSEASGAITGLQAQIDGLRGKTVTVKVVTDRAALATYAAQNGMRTVGGYADGGYTGPGHKYQPAGIVHAGEVVWSQDDVAAHGGPRKVDAMRRFRGYADGGIVIQGDSSDLRGGLQAMTEIMANSLTKVGVAGSGALSGAWGSIWQYVKARVPAARINSTYRAGDPGYHGRGKAIDFGYGSGPGGAGSAGLALISRTLHDGVGRNLAELIYDGIGDDRPDLKNGRASTYSRGTQLAHTNHVHAAVFDQGGPLYPGYTVAYNGTGRTEWVSREMPGGGGRGGGPGPVPMNVVVNARVFIGDREITDIVRVEAGAVMGARDDRRTVGARSWQSG
jgi:hypothetical protein